MTVRRILGIIAIVAGVVALVLALAANAIFGRSPGFGVYQIIGTVAGAVAVLAGLFLALKRS